MAIATPSGADKPLARVLATLGGLPVAPGTIEVADVYFPFPDGRGPAQMLLNGVNVRFSVLVGVESILMGATFQRVARSAYPSDDPRGRVHVGSYDPRLR
ncbi:MAG: hypothetical protein ACI9EF_000319 [Pseudohongiellaceae bacterium]|jgi:hypothetical protein